MDILLSNFFQTICNAHKVLLSCRSLILTFLRSSDKKFLYSNNNHTQTNKRKNITFLDIETIFQSSGFFFPVTIENPMHASAATITLKPCRTMPRSSINRRTRKRVLLTSLPQRFMETEANTRRIQRGTAIAIKSQIRRIDNRPFCQ